MTQNNLDNIVRMKFGSHLYGTATKDSDTDYKGVFMPTREQIFLGNIPKSRNESTKTTRVEGVKNTSDDVDTEIYSLHYFIKLACEGQTVALDMLHAPDEMLICRSMLWHEIVKNRSKFYTKNLNAFIGYARRQAAKYGIKGSRLSEARAVLKFLSNCDDGLDKLSHYWKLIPTGEHVRFIESSPNGIRQIQVCGRIIQETVTMEYAHEIVGKFCNNYGKRAEMAANNVGIDWKAISHAFRAAYEVKQLLTEGTITFPLREAEYLKKIKLGIVDYQTEAAPQLDNLMSEVETLSEKSAFPAKPDRKFWDNFIIEAVQEECFR